MKDSNLILLTLLILIISGCVRKPKDVLGESDMASLMADLETAESYIQNQGHISNDMELKNNLTEYILKKHGLTKEEFDSTMTWYGRNIDNYREVQERADKILAIRQKKSSGSDEDNIMGNDLWPYSRHMRIDRLGISSNIKFSIPASELEKGDLINWNMHLRSNSSGNALLGVDYDNGTSSYLTQNVMGKKNVDISLQTDTGKVVKRIYGLFTINSDAELPMWIDSISMKIQPFDSTTYFRINTLRTYKGPHKKIIKIIDQDSLKSETPSRPRVSNPDISSVKEKELKPIPTLMPEPSPVGRSSNSKPKKPIRRMEDRPKRHDR